MRRIVTTLILLALLTLAPALSGCSSDQTDEANAAIDRSNQAVERAILLDRQAADKLEEVLGAEPAKANAAETLARIGEIEADVAAIAEELGIMKSEFGSIREMDVSEELKTYASQQIEIAEMQEESNDLMSEMLGVLRELHTAAAAGEITRTQWSTALDSVDKLLGEAEALDVRIEEKASESERYFDENGLGGG